MSRGGPTGIDWKPPQACAWDSPSPPVAFARRSMLDGDPAPDFQPVQAPHVGTQCTHPLPKQEPFPRPDCGSHAGNKEDSHGDSKSPPA